MWVLKSELQLSGRAVSTLTTEPSFQPQCVYFEKWSCCVVQISLESGCRMPQPPKCWVYSTPCLALGSTADSSQCEWALSDQFSAEIEQWMSSPRLSRLPVDYPLETVLPRPSHPPSICLLIHIFLFPLSVPHGFCVPGKPWLIHISRTPCVSVLSSPTSKYSLPPFLQMGKLRQS